MLAQGPARSHALSVPCARDSPNLAVCARGLSHIFMTKRGEKRQKERTTELRRSLLEETGPSLTVSSKC